MQDKLFFYIQNVFSINILFSNLKKKSLLMQILQHFHH